MTPRKRLRDLALLAALAMGLLVLLLQMRPADPPQPPAPHTQPDTMSADPARPVLPERETLAVEVQNGDTMLSILERAGLNPEASHQFIADVRPTYNLARLNAGETLTLSLEGGILQNLTYRLAPNRELHVRRSGNRYESQIQEFPYETRITILSGTINQSLFAALSRLGEGPELADKMASLYDYDIDFNRDIRQGDRLRLVVEKQFLRDRFCGYGPILAASFTNQGKSVEVFRFADASGMPAYFHPDGKGVRKMFLRCPLPFMSVTSRFGNRRHPVLGFSARPFGTDFGAPVGTPVRSTASGVVIRKSTHPVRGRYLEIRHPNHYETHYYHLSRFRPSIHVGQRVTQGEVVAYVGNTGRSTGPHLHYGVRQSGRWLNPLSMPSPSTLPLPGDFQPAFRQYLASLRSLMGISPLVSDKPWTVPLLLRFPTPREWLAANSPASQGKDQIL